MSERILKTPPDVLQYYKDHYYGKCKEAKKNKRTAEKFETIKEMFEKLKDKNLDEYRSQLIRLKFNPDFTKFIKGL